MNKNAPLAGLRVVDLTRILAGPYLTQMLASLGADVVKIEPPGGDPTRNQGSPDVSGVSYYFCGTNGGKRSVVLDLKNPDAQLLAVEIIKNADVIVENFRPGIMDKLGLSLERLNVANPNLIVLSISGTGSGADHDQPSFDLCTQARGGSLSLNGEPGRLPVRLAIPMGDLAGSFYGAIAILACLFQRERRRNGNNANVNNTKTPDGAGEFHALDLSLLDAQVALLGNWVPFAMLQNRAPAAVGGAHTSAAPYDVYEASDSPFAVAVFTEKFWLPFLRAVDLLTIQNDARFVNSDKRVAHRSELDAILRPHFKKRARAEWLTKLRAADVPAEPVANVLEAANDPAFRARGMMQQLELGGSAFPQVAFPVRHNDNVYFPGHPPLEIGKDTETVLSDWRSR
ncbi:MAG: CaiB/BaiF CoA transferase family protein [Planctomycetota bacterium]